MADNQAHRLSLDGSPLVDELLARGIEARMVQGGVLVCDPYALLDLLCGETPPPLSPDVANPIGALQEHCQRRDKPLPAYAFTSTGTAHAPAFLCTATALGCEARAEAPSKAAAKTQAARNLITTLRSKS